MLFLFSVQKTFNLDIGYCNYDNWESCELTNIDYMSRDIDITVAITVGFAFVFCAMICLLSYYLLRRGRNVVNTNTNNNNKNNNDNNNGFGLFDYDKMGAIFAAGMSKVVEDFLKDLRKELMYDRGSTASVGRGEDEEISFKERVKLYYGQSICMITGLPGAEGAHTVPASAKESGYGDLKYGYCNAFCTASPRNALLLIPKLQHAWDAGQIYFVMNPMTHRIYLYSNAPEYDKYDGMCVIYLNDAALPYRRALKDRFDNMLRTITRFGGSLDHGSETTPFSTAAELSDKQSEMNDEMERKETDEKSNNNVNFNLTAYWICNNCNAQVCDYDSMCRCGQFRNKDLGIGTQRQQKLWQNKAKNIYGAKMKNYYSIFDWAVPRQSSPHQQQKIQTYKPN